MMFKHDDLVSKITIVTFLLTANMFYTRWSCQKNTY